LIGARIHNFYILSIDLRDRKAFEDLLFISTVPAAEGGESHTILDPQAATLVLSEIVLVYMPPEASDAIIACLSSRLAHRAAFVLYEQISPNDPFGNMMVSNIAKRGSPLLGIEKYPTLDSQVERFKNLGWDSAAAKTMLEIYNRYGNLSGTSLVR